MIILPAIDIKDGVCVRLYQGDYGQVTTYDTDPVRVAPPVTTISRVPPFTVIAAAKFVRATPRSPRVVHELEAGELNHAAHKRPHDRRIIGDQNPVCH